MRKTHRRPGTKQRRDDRAWFHRFAAVLFWLAQFVHIVLEIIKLCRELTG